MTINQRVQKIIDELYAGNKRAFSLAVDISPTVTENIVGKRLSNPSFEVTSKILKSLENINERWLMIGSGEMLKLEKTTDLVSEDAHHYGKGLSYTAKPFLNTGNITYGMPDAFQLSIKTNSHDNIPIPFISDYDFSLRNHGDSMVNGENIKRSINDQDIVACKLWKSKSHIAWGEVYALATSNGYIIKKLMPSEIEDHIKCVSFNEKEGYNPFDLPVSEIFDIAIVVGVARISAW